jgi:hypothetical protein
MLQAFLVEKLDANPLIIVDGPLSFVDDAEAQSKIRSAVEAYNAHAVVSPAEGALVWSDADAARKFEFRIGDGLRPQRFGENQNLVGYYTCQSGRKYRYFGRCVSWVPFKQTYREIYLYHHDKKFVHDDVFSSRDMLVVLSEDLLRIEIDIDLLHRVALHHTEDSIEEWDRTEGAKSATA